MIINVIENGGRRIIAICDKNLLGKKIENDKLQLDLSSKFYFGEEKTEDEISNLINNFFTMNVVGEKSVDFILKKLNLDKNSVKKIDKVPYLHIFRV